MNFSDRNHHLPSPTNPPQNPLAAAFSHLQSQLRSAATLLFPPPSPSKCPPFARIPSPPLATRDAIVEERLSGVPVYALSNSAGEFVLVSSKGSAKSLGFFCFSEDDAASLLEQMRAMNGEMKQGSKVVAVALNKVVQLKVDGVAFRFIPDSKQVANAIKEKQRAGESTNCFSGVPVFQSRSLVLKSQNKRYRPVFFRKEDLEDSLYRASHDQRRLNPALRKGDVQVSVLEEIVVDLKESSVSEWDDVVFIPPGLNLSTGLSDDAPTASTQ